MDGNLAKTPLVDLLRHIDLGASAEITEPSGWSYFTNIGNLTHMAADELDKKEEELAALRKENELLKTFCKTERTLYKPRRVTFRPHPLWWGLVKLLERFTAWMKK